MAPREQILLLDILEVLRRDTDEQKGLRQKELIEKIQKSGGYEELYERRKTVQRNLDKLIRYYEGEDEEILVEELEEKRVKEYRYLHLFTQEELRLLIDSLLFSPHIPAGQRKDLIERLQKLSSTNFKTSLKHVHTFEDNTPVNHELFYNVGMIDEAIQQNKRITFAYTTYVVNEDHQLELQLRKKSTVNDSGEREEQTRIYEVSPYQLIVADGKYYVICNTSGYSNVSHYRVDRMAQITITPQRRKRAEEVEGLEYGLNLAQHKAEHVYMFGGNSIRAKVRIGQYAINDFIDWFGMGDLHFSDRRDGEVTVTMRVNEMALRKWALQYGLHATVLSPPTLVEGIREDLRRVVQRYEIEE